MIQEDLVQKVWDTQDPKQTILNLITNNYSLQENIKKLKNVYNILEREQLMTEVTLKRSKLAPLIDQKGKKIIIKDDKKDLITQQILDAYYLTSEILQQLNLINNVDYVFTYIDDNGNYQRLGNIHLTINDVRLEAASSKRGYYSLRLKQSSLLAKQKTEEEKRKDIIINRHFQKFAEPFYEHEKKGSWRVNKGVLAETFERHWENLNHSFENLNIPSGDTDIESVGKRWLMYRQSSGNAAYYTGPDTMYAQVKNANASFVDNLNTVLNTMEAVLAITDPTKEIPNLAESLKKAFQASPDKQSMNKKIWDALSDTVRAEIQKELNFTEVIAKGNNVFFT